MGLCRYCNKSAGLFRSQHRFCEERHEQTVAKILSILAGALNDTTLADEIWGRVEFFANDGLIGERELKSLVISALTTAIAAAFADHLLSEQEDERIADLCSAFDLSSDDLGPSSRTLIKARVLRGLDEGKLENVTLKSHVWLQSDERPVWEFSNARYLTIHSRVRYVGGSQGVSIRIARGVYYRMGRFHGEPIKTEEMVEEGVGTLVVTTSNLIFDSPRKALRLPFRKILAVHAYGNAIEVLSDGANKKPAIFKVDDPTFAANILGRLH